MKQITINPLSSASIGNAVAELEAYLEELEQKEHALLFAVAEEGVRTANAVYANHPGDHGSGSVTIGELGENYASIVATAPEGEIGFIEFGTGTRHPEWAGIPGGFVPPAHGTYGHGYGAHPGYWFWTDAEGNKHYRTGADPANAMVAARDAMIEAAMTKWRTTL